MSIGRSIGVGLLILLLFFVVLAAFDPEPPPEVLALLEPKPRLPANDNLANALFGFGADDPAQMAEAGYAAVTAINELLDEAPIREGDDTVDRAVALLPEALADIGDLTDGPCALREPGCAASLAADPDALRSLVDSHRELIDRYRRLFDFPAFRSEVLPDFRAPFPPYAPPAYAHRLYQAAVLLSYLDGDREAALDALDREMSYQRRLLGQTDVMITWAATVAELGDSVKLRSAITATPDEAAATAPLPRLTDAELDSGAALEGELAMQLRLALQMGEDPAHLGSELEHVPPALLRPLYKPGHAASLIHRCFQAEMALGRRPRAELWTTDTGAACEVGFWDYLRNPIGTILFAVARPDFRRQFSRAHDLDALIVLANARRELLAAGTAASELAGALSAVAARAGNTLSEGELRWDDAAGALVFDARMTSSEMATLAWDPLREPDATPAEPLK